MLSNTSYFFSTKEISVTAKCLVDNSGVLMLFSTNNSVKKKNYQKRYTIYTLFTIQVNIVILILSNMSVCMSGLGELFVKNSPVAGHYEGRYTEDPTSSESNIVQCCCIEYIAIIYLIKLAKHRYWILRIRFLLFQTHRMCFLLVRAHALINYAFIRIIVSRSKVKTQ